MIITDGRLSVRKNNTKWEQGVIPLKKDIVNTLLSQGFSDFTMIIIRPEEQINPEELMEKTKLHNERQKYLAEAEKLAKKLLVDMNGS